MTGRDRRLLLALAGLVVVMMAAVVSGVPGDVLLAAPVLVLVLPLLAGRYVGEERLTRLAAAFALRGRHVLLVRAPGPPRTPRILPRGGCLIAAALATRPPPRISALHV